MTGPREPRGERRAPHPLLAGLTCRCPACGRGALFSGYLRVAERCGSCGHDLTKGDPGDGPAVFVIFVVGFIVVPLALVMSVAGAASWLVLTVTAPLALVLILALLPLFKSVLIALQHHHGAAEARLEDDV